MANISRFPRIRTLTKAIEELHKEDPGCSLTYYTLLKLVKAGTIPSINTVNRTLIDINRLSEYLYPDIEEDEELPSKIRKIEETI